MNDIPKGLLDLDYLSQETNNRLFQANVVEPNEEDNKYYYSVNMLLTLYKAAMRKLDREVEE